MKTPDEGPAAGPVGSRKEVGDSESSSEHPPRADVDEEGAASREEHPRAEDSSLPATAHGEDKVSAEDQAQPIDPTSMYDNRPEEDKDWDPTT